ncbi:MAG: AAA family ATPase [Flavobacteriales bacterium]|nr:AAA family ATPase [Flavobacteriales bacterium]
MKNPFHINRYEGPEYFCDREQETAAIHEAVHNGRNVTLISKRRMGKTGLIHHALHRLAKEGIRGFLIDIYATQDTNGLVNAIGSKLIGQTDTWPQKVTGRLRDLVESFRPRITYDGLTGQPSVEFYLQHDRSGSTLMEILHRLDAQGQPMVIAIDEFQQINRYPEKNLEALLRTHVQQMKNLRFIFSGSEMGMLVSMFTEAGRPFFQSAQLMHLGPIDTEIYGEFISRWMQKDGKKIGAEALQRIFELTNVHTYYVQVLCNRLYAREGKVISTDDVNKTLAEILNENDYVYYNYRHILTDAQWQLLKAVAKEGKAYSLNSSAFLRKHGLGAASSVNRSLTALVERDMICHETGEETSYHQLQDVFFSQWLRLH